MIPRTQSAKADLEQVLREIGVLVGGASATPRTFPDVREWGPWGVGGTGGFLADNREGETLEAAIRALEVEKPRGARLLIPRGDARLYAPPSFKGLTNFRLIGAGGLDGSGAFGGAAGAATRIIYAGEGERAWDYRSGSYFCGAEDIQFLADNLAFTGHLIDLAGAQLWDFTRCSFQPNAATLNANNYGIFCANANSGTFNKCKFTGAGYGAVGRLEPAQFAIAITFNQCVFAGNVNRHVLNAHKSWWFNQCVFENLVTNKGVTAAVGALAFTEPCPAAGVDFSQCWFGNSGAAGVQIEYRGTGLRVNGGEAGAGEGFLNLLGATSDIYVDLDALNSMSFGVSIPAAGSTRGRFNPGVVTAVPTQVAGLANAKGWDFPTLGAKKAFGKIASPAAEAAALKVAVDQIREYLISKGITEE